MAIPASMLASISIGVTFDPEVKKQVSIAWPIHIAVYAVVFSILGLGIARSSRRLLILWFLLILAIIGYWVYMFWTSD